MDRYNHDLGGEDTDDTDDTPVFGSFSSYTPQYRKQHYSWSRVASTSSVSSTTSSTSLNVGAPSTAVSALTTETIKMQVTESSTSPTNTIEAVPKCRKISAPLACSVAQANKDKQMMNKVLTTPQLRKIEVGIWN